MGLINVEQVKLMAEPLWFNRIFPALIPIPVANNKHQPCPMCGGRDRFRASRNAGKLLYICNSCGGGDGIGLVAKVHNCDFITAVRHIAGVLGISDVMPINQAEIKRMQDEAARQAIHAQRAIEQMHAAKAAKALEFYNAASLLGDDGHPYLQRKGIGSPATVAVKFRGAGYSAFCQRLGVGAQVTGGKALLVPVYDINNRMINLQAISACGSHKPFIYGARLKGGFMPIPKLYANIAGSDSVVWLAEGLATGAKVYNLFGGTMTVLVCFAAANLYEVCGLVRAKRPNKKILIAADNDWQNKVNTGIKYANKCAIEYGAVVVAPNFVPSAVANGVSAND